MIIDILILIGGLILIILGANYLTDGSVIIARKFNISELVIGLTIIAIGTSTPELVVSITSAIKGSSEMAIGNVVGSNIFNALAIIGVTALVRPIRLSRENTYRNIPLGIVTSVFFLIIASSLLGVSFMPLKINRFEGILLLTGFFAFMYYTIVISGRGKKVKSIVTEYESDIKPKRNILGRDGILAIPMIFGGLAALIYGGDLFLNSAITIAKAAGISEYIISATLMAGGTSLPELASCVVAARRGKSQLALGNVIGSNISNILLVLGGAATITPLSLVGVSMVDLAMVLVSSSLLIITPFTFKKGQIDRVEGLILIIIYICYVGWLLK